MNSPGDVVHVAPIGAPAATQAFRYWAFISYNHADEQHARWLHRRLESYRLPKRLVGTLSEAGGFVRPASLRPVYRDRDEVSANPNLGTHIQRALEDSRNLIVICSPHTVFSRWVDQEVRHFRSLGRSDHVFCLVVDGPDDAAIAQWMPPSLRSEIAAGIEPLAADARPRKDGRKLASLRLIAAMVDVRFDELRQREQEQRLRRLTLAVGIALALLAVVGWLALDAVQQRGVAEQQTVNAKERQKEAEDARDAAHVAQLEAKRAEKDADERRREAESAKLLEETANKLARQRQAQAEAAEQQALRALKDATLRRLAAEAQAMFGGARAGGDLMAMRLALAGYAFEPRTDLLGAMQLMVSADASLRAWDVPGNSISAFAQSPDGATVVTATAGPRGDHRIRFWRAATGALVGEIQTKAYVTGLALTAAGDVLLAVDSEGRVQRWNVLTRERHGPPMDRQDKAWIDCAAISPDGRQWVIGTSSKLLLWSDTGGTATTMELVGHSDRVRSIAFSPDGKQIVSSSDDKTVRVLDAQTGTAIGDPIVGHREWVTSAVFSPDGQSVGSVSHDHTIRQWSARPGFAMKLQIDDAGSGVDHVAYSRDGRRLVSAGQDGLVRVWDAQTGKPVGAAVAGHRGTVTGAEFSPDGTRVVSAGRDGTVRIWDSRGIAQSASLVVQHGDNVNGVTIAKEAGRHKVAAIDFDGTLRQWDPATGQSVGALIRVPRYSLSAVAYSADAARLITASGDGVIRVWNAQTGRAALPPFRGHDKPATAVAASNDGRFIVSADRGGGIIMWDAASGSVVHRLNMAPYMMWSVAFSPDGRRFAASGSQGFFALWDTSTGQVIHRAQADAEAAYPALVFGADGRYIAIADRRQRTIALRSALSGQPVARYFSGHQGAVEGVAISPDGKFIASADSNGLVRLWNIDSGEPLGVPLSVGSQTAGTIGMGFTADGHKLVAAGASGKVFVWDAPGIWPRLLCERLTRNLSESEWTSYIGKVLPYKSQCPQYQALR